MRRKGSTKNTDDIIANIQPIAAKEDAYYTGPLHGARFNRPSPPTEAVGES